MSFNSRSAINTSSFSPPRWLRRGLAAMAACGAAAVFAIGAASANTEQLALQGEGTLRWYGLKIYEARLFAAQRLSPEKVLQQPFALELTYARDFAGQKIAESSIDEIRKLDGANAARFDQWRLQMQNLFPSVKAGDRLRGVYEPGQGARFFHNNQLLGAIDDAEFARAFFSIWLDPRTAKPDLRNQLLGLASAQRR